MWHCEATGNCGATRRQRQKWVFTDVVKGPWCDMSPEAPLSLLPLNSIDVVVEMDAFVNVFRLANILHKHDGIDLVLSYGSWPNVLTDEICEEVLPSSPTPGPRRAMIQRQQKQVWNFPDEFLVSFTAAVMAQTPASFLLVGPPHYTWGATARTRRPMHRFMLPVYDCTDYYQGFKKLNDLMATYWPMDEEKMPTKMDLVSIVALHSKVLVLSSGRARLWSDVMQRADKVVRKYGVPYGIPPLCAGMRHMYEGRDKYQGLVTCRNEQAPCEGDYLCRWCLRRIKQWSGLPDRRLTVWVDSKGTQTDDELLS